MFAWIRRWLEQPPELPARVRPLTEALTEKPGMSLAERRRARREIDLAISAFAKAHPDGIRLAELDFGISKRDVVEMHLDKLAAAVSLANEEKRVTAPEEILAGSPRPEVMREWLGKKGQFLHLWHLSRFLTLGDIAQVQFVARGNGGLYRESLNHPLLRYVDKIEVSMDNWSTTETAKESEVTWEKVAKFHEAIAGFDFGIKDFDISVDWVKDDNSGRGWGNYTGDYGRNKGWLDGELALIVSYKGKKVMLIGISPSLDGMLVNQIQLFENKGNRWLYKLPLPYFEYVLSRMLKSCNDAGVRLYYPTGTSVRDYITNSFGASAQVRERLQQNYDRELTTINKSAHTYKVRYYDYHWLTAKDAPAAVPTTVEQLRREAEARRA